MNHKIGVYYTSKGNAVPTHLYVYYLQRSIVRKVMVDVNTRKKIPTKAMPKDVTFLPLYKAVRDVVLAEWDVEQAAKGVLGKTDEDSEDAGDLAKNALVDMMTDPAEPTLLNRYPAPVLK